MKKIILGLSSAVLMLCAVSCPDSKPVSLKYADGEVKVGKIPAEYKTVMVSSGKVQGVYAPSTTVDIDRGNGVLVFGDLPESQKGETVVIVGSKETIKFEGLTPDQQLAALKKLQALSDEVKNIFKTDLTLNKTATSATEIKIEVGTTDKKAITLTTNAETVKVGDYVILVDGNKVVFEQDKETKTKWTGGAKADVVSGTTKAAIYKAKGNYLKNEIIL